MKKIALNAGDLIEICEGRMLHLFTILEITSNENKESWNGLETIIYQTISFSHSTSMVVNFNIYDSDQIRIISSPSFVDEGK